LSCHNAIYVDRTYDCAQFLQSIDRIHRLGLAPDTQTQIFILRSRLAELGTVDHLVDLSLTAKQSSMAQLLEGSEVEPLFLSDDPITDAEGSDEDLGAIIRYLLGEGEAPLRA
jgi:hypothetical protein